MRSELAPLYASMTPRSIAEFLRPGLFQFTMVLAMVLFGALYQLLGLPPVSVMVQWLLDLYQRHGMVIVAVGAFVESLILVGVYAPGSLSIVIGVLSVGDSVLGMIQIWCVALIASVAAQCINHLVGKRGYQKVIAAIGGQEAIGELRSRLQRSTSRTIWTTAFFPNFLAMSMVAAGTVDIALRRLIVTMIAAIAAWGVFWIVLTHFVVRQIDVGNDRTYAYVILVVLLWGIGICAVEAWRRTKVN